MSKNNELKNTVTAMLNAYGIFDSAGYSAQPGFALDVAYSMADTGKTDDAVFQDIRTRWLTDMNDLIDQSNLLNPDRDYAIKKFRSVVSISPVLNTAVMKASKTFTASITG